jgi:hypothetical protein
MPDWNYLNVTEAAAELGINRKTLYAQLKQNGAKLNGITIAVQINHVWRCLPEAIARVKRGEDGQRNADPTI